MSRLGDLFGARFQAGPLSQYLIQSAIDSALASGRASTLTINEVQGRKVMRITGGLNAGLRNDFLHGVIKVGVSEIDLSEVTDIDNEGVDLCRRARTEHQIPIVRPSACVRSLAVGSGSLAGFLNPAVPARSRLKPLRALVSRQLRCATLQLDFCHSKKMICVSAQ